MNEKPPVRSIRRFEVTVTVKEIVDNPEYFNAFEPQGITMSSHDGYFDMSRLNRHNEKVPRTIKREVGFAGSEFAITLLEMCRLNQGKATIETAMSHYIRSAANVCALDKNHGLAVQVAKWLERNPL